LPEDKLKFKNIVTIEIIDRETGKVKKKIVTENVVLDACAYFVVGCFDGSQTTAPTPIQYVNLFDPNKTYIKSLTGSWGSRTSTGSAWQNTFTATDSGTDAYNVQYLSLSIASMNTWGGGYFANAQASAVSKGSADILKVTWTVAVSYSSAP
jgi:hypothetical protein